MEQAIDSLRIEQHKDRAVLTGNIPMALVKQLATPAAQIAAPGDVLPH
jgi:hypothetical protein